MNNATTTLNDTARIPPRRTLTLGVLGCTALLLAVGLPTVSGQGTAEEDTEAIGTSGPDVGEPVNPDAEARPFNVLVLDARSGRVVESKNNGAPDTTITLQNIPSAVGSYTLRDPQGRDAFVDAPPTLDLTVAFVYVPLVKSSGLPYTVVHNDVAGEHRVLSFTPSGLPRALLPKEASDVSVNEPDATVAVATGDIPEAPATFGAQGGGNPEPPRNTATTADKTTNNGEPVDETTQTSTSPSPSPQTGKGPNTKKSTPTDSGGARKDKACWYDSRNGQGETRTVAIRSEVKWTPLNVNHAPYGGSSTATSSWSWMGGFYIFPGGITSSKETNIKLTLPPGEGGMTKALYQLARWTHYDRMTCNYNNQWTHGYYVAVSSWAPEGPEVSQSFYIHGASRYTDGDDTQWITKPSQYSGVTYSSVGINPRYAAADRVHTGTATFVVSSSRLFTIGASISVGGSYFTFDALKGDVTSGSGNYYEYNMPSGTTRADYLQGQSNGWAFCTPSLASC